ncbi:MAG: aldehyde dehydrogenase family protein [Candidatus Binataceae bacterium]
MAAAPSLEIAARGAKSPRTLEFLKSGPKKLLIDGKWVPAKSGKTFDSVNPANEEVLAQVAEGGAEDIDEAVKAARKAFEDGPWSKMRPHDRTKYLLKIADLIEKNREELAELSSLDNGAPIMGGQGLVTSANELFTYFAGWPTKIYGETNPSTPDMFNYTLREPLGVCGQIIPWNGPLMSASNKMAHALSTGNTVVLKPAEQACLVVLRLGELLMEAGIPEGVVNIVPGFGPVAGAALSNHPDVDKVAFTGSTTTGKEILKASVATLKHVSLELGGKSPHIIFADSDLEGALNYAAIGIFGNTGQACIAGSRIFVQEKIHDQFVEGLVKRAGQHKLGAQFEPGTTMGPVVSKVQHQRVLGYINAGKEEGAHTATGGGPGPQPKGYFVQPTVFTGVRNDMKIAREEIFGPVAAVLPFKDENDAVFQGNDTTYGLAAGIWTRDVSRAHKVARRLKAGMVWINCYMVLDFAMPFGGYKQSGQGREFSNHSIDMYTQVKSVFVKL